MTGEDHNTDAIVAALRQPALPSEQAGEAAAVNAMIGAQTRLPAASRTPRSRRGIAVAVVTVASLGIGGLAAAGPGIFLPAADDPEPSTPPSSTVAEESVDGTSNVESTREADAPDRVAVDADVECAEGNHGRTVSSVAAASGDVAAAARSDCGMPDAGPRSGTDDTDDTDGSDGAIDDSVEPEAEADADAADCAARGRTVSSVARSDDRTADDVVEAAQDDCADDSDDKGDEAPGRSGEAPGRSGEAPGQSGNAPGQTDDTPGRSGDAPGQSGDTPGQSGDTPGQSGDTPGQSGSAPGRPGDTAPEPPAPSAPPEPPAAPAPPAPPAPPEPPATPGPPADPGPPDEGTGNSSRGGQGRGGTP